MDIQENIVNKVAQSGLVTLDPAAFYPAGERVIYDIKDNLYMELILREKDFREFVKTHDWTQYEGKMGGQKKRSPLGLRLTGTTMNTTRGDNRRRSFHHSPDDSCDCAIPRLIHAPRLCGRTVSHSSNG